MADIQAVAEPEPVVAAPDPEIVVAEIVVAEVAVPVEGEAVVAAPAPEGEEIRMEDVLGKGTRKRPSAATEDVDELQAETRRF